MANTPNFGWTKPTVGGSGATWGTIENTLFDDIDADLKTVADSVKAGPVILASGNLATGVATVLAADLSGYTGYNRFEINIDNLTCSGLVELLLVASTDGASTFLSSSYNWSGTILTSSYVWDDSTSDTSISLSGGLAGAANYQVRLNLYGINVSKPLQTDSLVSKSGPPQINIIGAGGHASTSVNGVKILSTGTVTGGTYRIIGYP